jgi:hypothetical protein
MEQIQRESKFEAHLLLSKLYASQTSGKERKEAEALLAEQGTYNTIRLIYLPR